MVEDARVFSQRNHKTGLTVWFFYAREGSFGSFRDMKSAVKALDALNRSRVENQANGGSINGKKSAQFSLERLVDFVAQAKGLYLARSRLRILGTAEIWDLGVILPAL